METAPSPLYSRVVSLETRLRNLRVLVAVLMAALAVVAATGWLGWGTVRARRVEIADRDGTTRMVLGAEKGPSILLYGVSGQESIAITAMDEAQSAIMIGGESHARLTSSNLLITTSDGGIVLSVSGDGRTIFQLLGDEGKASVSVGAGGGTADLKMRSGSESERIEVGFQ